MPMLPFWLPTGPTGQLPTTLPTGAPLLPQDLFPATVTHLKAMQRVTSSEKDREKAGSQTIFPLEMQNQSLLLKFERIPRVYMLGPMPIFFYPGH